MNPLIYIIPVIPIVLILAGVYFTFFAKHDQARNYMDQVLEDVDRRSQIKQLQQQHFVLKKRNKTQNRFLQKVDMDLERANLMLKPNEFLMISLGSAVVCFLLMFVMGKGLFLSFCSSLGGLFLPWLYVKLRIMFRMSKARAQFADVLDTMVGCFKSGYGFSRAIQTVADNFEDPWSTELTKVATEMNFGSTQEDALLSLGKRVPNPDVWLFVTAMLIQKETGGNLAELLMNLSHTIRERYKLLSKVTALSAQGKLSAIIVFCIPFGLAGVFTVMMPTMMNEFVHHPIGIILLVFAFCMQLVGGLVLKKIVTLEV
jgi:tight adherence protein B